MTPLSEKPAPSPHDITPGRRTVGTRRPIIAAARVTPACAWASGCWQLHGVEAPRDPTCTDSLAPKCALGTDQPRQHME